jgi:drug/metabolite transporter superfamily protein YnfA
MEHGRVHAGLGGIFTATGVFMLLSLGKKIPSPFGVFVKTLCVMMVLYFIIIICQGFWMAR